MAKRHVAKKPGRRAALAEMRFYEAKHRTPRTKVTPRLFHYGEGFGQQTWCGLTIAPWGDRTGTGPDWGGALTEGITCEDCILNFIAMSAFELNNAVKVLGALKRKKTKTT